MASSSFLTHFCFFAFDLTGFVLSYYFRGICREQNHWCSKEREEPVLSQLDFFYVDTGTHTFCKHCTASVEPTVLNPLVQQSGVMMQKDACL